MFNLQILYKICWKGIIQNFPIGKQLKNENYEKLDLKNKSFIEK